MRVGLNATCLNARPSGAKQRFLGLYGALIRRRPDIEFIIYEPCDWSAEAEMQPVRNVTFRPTPLPSDARLRRALGGLSYWPRQLVRDRLDLFETFHLPLVRAPSCPTLLTIHDARPIRSDVSLLKRGLQYGILRHALRRADHIVTVSNEMRRELLTVEPLAAISTIYNGIDAALFHACRDRRDVRVRWTLPSDYLLAVGHLEPRKNLVRLVEAIGYLRAEGRDIGLVIVGNDSGAGQAIAEAIQRENLQDQVRILQGVSNEVLCAIYKTAALVVFPSTYEGFGIPVLEAMAAERPLVCSDLAVFRELTGDCGAYFPPLDSWAIASTIAKVLDSPKLQKALISYGQKRVRDFAFDMLASKLEALYVSLGGSKWKSHG